MKTWKLIQLAGVLVLLVGVVARVGAGAIEGTYMIVIGTLAFAVGRIGAWLQSDKP